MVNMSAVFCVFKKSVSRLVPLLLVIGFWATSALADDPVTLKLFALSDAPELKSKQGYLLIDLDIESNAASLHFARVSSNSGQQWLEPGKATKHRSKTLKLDFSALDNGLYVRGLQAGVYQITRINAPYYDLPFWIGTAGQRTWRFNIEAGKVNYVGKLSISAERSTDYVDVRMLNRFATDLQHNKAALLQLPVEMPLVLSMGVQDHFDSFMEGDNQ